MYGSGYPGSSGYGVQGRGFPFIFYPLVFAAPAGIGGFYLYREEEVGNIIIDLGIFVSDERLSTDILTIPAVLAARSTSSPSHPLHQHSMLLQMTPPLRIYVPHFKAAAKGRPSSPYPLRFHTSRWLTPRTQSRSRQSNTIAPAVLS